MSSRVSAGPSPGSRLRSRWAFAGSWATALVLAVAGCAAAPADPCGGGEPEAPVEGRDHPWERLYLVRDPRAPGQLLAGAAAGSLPPGGELGADGARARVDAQGAATLALPDRGLDQVELALGGERVAFRVRDPECARRAALHPPVEDLGSVPNDLIFGSEGAVLVRSGDNAVSSLDVRGQPTGRGVRLPEVAGPLGPRPANPWFAADAGAAGVVVSAFGQGRVYRVFAGPQPVPLASPGTLELSAPITLPRAVDADQDGVPEQEVRRLIPRTPQPVAVSAGLTLAAFTNFFSPRLGPDAPPIYLPGVLAAWTDDGAPPRLVELGCDNPQELRPLSGGRLLVVCSGVLDAQGAAVQALTPGAARIYALPGLELLRHVPLGDFAPGTALEAGGALWVGSLARAALLRVDLGQREDRREIRLNEESVDSVFRLQLLPQGLIAAPSFNSDRVHLVDPVSGALDPPPFFGPLVLGPGRPIFDGLQILAMRPGRPGVDFQGPELFALAGIASRLTPIELRRIYGP